MTRLLSAVMAALLAVVLAGCGTTNEPKVSDQWWTATVKAVDPLPVECSRKYVRAPGLQPKDYDSDEALKDRIKVEQHSDREGQRADICRQWAARQR